MTAMTTAEETGAFRAEAAGEISSVAALPS
jgi:hypothetical protein